MMRTLFITLVFCLSLVFTPVNSSPDQLAFLRGGYAPASVTPPSFTPAWQTLKICCGGLLNNIQQATSDDTMVASSNTNGAFLRKNTGSCVGSGGTTYPAPCWEQLFTQTSSPLTLSQIGGANTAALEIGVCNNNTNDAYAFMNGNLWVTTNLKAAATSRTWAQTTLTNSISGNVGVSAGTGRAIFCDPANPNVVYAATPTGVNVFGNGLLGASATHAAISTSLIGTTGSIPSGIAIDPNSTTGTCSAISGSPTCSLHFWIFTESSGVYETYTGGASFTKTTGGPTTFTHVVADKFSQLWSVNGSTTVSKYTPNGTAGGGTWTSSTAMPENNGANNIAVDPTSSSLATNTVFVTYAGGGGQISTNNGGVFTSNITSPTYASAGVQPAWLGVANQLSGGFNFATMQDMVYDNSGNLFGAAGIGIWEAPVGTISSNPTAWTANTIGEEQLVAVQVVSAPGLGPCMSVWDRGIWCGNNPDVFPSTYWTVATSNSYGSLDPIEGGWALDWASSSTSVTYVAWVNSNNGSGNAPASSSDGGHNWTLFPTMPASTNNGGAVAALSSTNWLLNAGDSNQPLSTTTNSAGAWATSTISGNTLPWTQNIFVTSHLIPLAADKVAANTYCVVDSAGNFFKSTNGGANFTLAAASGATDAGTFNYGIKAVPGQTGTFLFSAGNDGGGATSQHLWITTNTCTTWTQVNTNLTNIYAFGIGAPKPGNTFPTVYVYAALSGVQGVYESDNANLGLSATWSLIGAPSSAQTWPANSLDFITTMSGDTNVYGRIYVGWNGSGFGYIDTTTACPWVNFSSIKPTDNVTGTISLQAQSSGLVPVTAVDFYVDGTLIGRQTSGSGTPTTYTQSWVTGGVATGAHTLKVLAEGSTNAGCTTSLASGNSFSIPITTH